MEGGVPAELILPVALFGGRSASVCPVTAWALPIFPLKCSRDHLSAGPRLVPARIKLAVSCHPAPLRSCFLFRGQGSPVATVSAGLLAPRCRGWDGCAAAAAPAAPLTWQPGAWPFLFLTSLPAAPRASSSRSLRLLHMASGSRG